MTDTQPQTHRIRWFVVIDGERFPRKASMRGQWGYDVVCSCGWETRTGGATRSYVEQEVFAHKFRHTNPSIAAHLTRGR